MALQIGIVGLPNVGKSTLFNALTSSKQAASANFPFCTIDPNVGVVEVPDQRLDQLVEIVKPQRRIPTAIEFVDIAGLVKGASQGEGLGNKFLAHIRQCDAVAQVVRVFDDPNVVHVHGKVDPAGDIEVIHSELILADLSTVEKRLAKAQSEAKSGNPKAKAYADMVARLKLHLEQGKLARDFDRNDEEASGLRELHLLTDKEFLYVANVDEESAANWNEAQLRELLKLQPRDEVIPISAQIEEEVSQLGPEDAKAFLQDLGLKEPGLFALIRSAYHALGLMTYFTAGVQEVRAWTVKRGATAPEAAGVIHTDFQKGFIAADVIGFDDFVACGGEQGAREKGKLRSEGKQYVMKDGDVVHFKFNV
ncbi:redox-regulated ATPase YchF [Candidatus Peregrinibacteria bacterium CG11_big_fil_rev_8_21_14_0_20_46_8]|nr:MAG: redox-regulated ATPase YchF [Candidatus Peregrinibacteria bacterium CG11_big_fil_rev_8_21_14_0_20_46_8]